MTIIGAGGSAHGRRRSQRRTVACAVRKPIAAAAAGRPGSVSHSAAGIAATMSAGDVAAGAAPANGAARFASVSSTGKREHRAGNCRPPPPAAWRGRRSARRCSRRSRPARARSRSPRAVPQPGPRRDRDHRGGHRRHQQQCQSRAGLQAACQHRQPADPHAVALDQRAGRHRFQPPRQPVRLQVGIRQPHRDHRRQRHRQPLGATAQPGPQQLAQLVLGQRCAPRRCRACRPAAPPPDRAACRRPAPPAPPVAAPARSAPTRRPAASAAPAMPRRPSPPVPAPPGTPSPPPGTAACGRRSRGAARVRRTRRAATSGASAATATA